MQAGAVPDAVSFQCVVVPTLLLVTLPRFCNSTLTSLRGPVLAVLHSELPLDRVRHCVEALVQQKTILEAGSGNVVSAQRHDFLPLLPLQALQLPAPLWISRPLQSLSVIVRNSFEGRPARCHL